MLGSASCQWVSSLRQKNKKVGFSTGTNFVHKRSHKMHQRVRVKKKANFMLKTNIDRKKEIFFFLSQLVSTAEGGVIAGLYWSVASRDVYSFWYWLEAQFIFSEDPISLTLPRGLFFPCLTVCFFVSKITQKVLNQTCKRDEAWAREEHTNFRCSKVE